MKRPPSPLFSLVLSLLLLGMQLDGAVHKLGHLGEQLARGHDASIVSPNDEPCAECLLLASGANAVAASVASAPVDFVAQPRDEVSPVTYEPAFSSYYLSRAPPTLL